MLKIEQRVNLKYLQCRFLKNEINNIIVNNRKGIYNKELE